MSAHVARPAAPSPMAMATDAPILVEDDSGTVIEVEASQADDGFDDVADAPPFAPRPWTEQEETEQYYIGDVGRSPWPQPAGERAPLEHEDAPPAVKARGRTPRPSRSSMQPPKRRSLRRRRRAMARTHNRRLKQGETFRT